MTGLLPEKLVDSVSANSPEAASESFGLVAVILLIVLMVEQEVLSREGLGRERAAALRSVVLPLLIMLVVVLSNRLAAVVP
jgi:hypothetical protein